MPLQGDKLPDVSDRPPTTKETHDAQVLLRKLHVNAGHPNNSQLARTLRDDGAPPWVIKMAMELKCDQCDKFRAPQAKPVATMEEQHGHLGLGGGGLLRLTLAEAEDFW